MKFSRLTPQQVVLGIGIAIGVITVISGIAAQVNDFAPDSEETRKVFINIPDVLRLVFYTVIPVLIVYGAWMFSLRVKNWRRGGPDNRATTTANAGRRLGDFRSGVYMQTLLREPGAGVMHSLMYFSFLILLGVTTVLEIDHQLPTELKFLHGGTYKGYAAVGDAAGLVFTASIVWALLRRYGPRRFRPYRIRIKSRPEHMLILGTFLAIGVTGFAAEAFRIALEGMPEYEEWSFIGYPLATLVENNGSLSGWHQFWWIFHVVSFMTFLVILPVTMLRHIFTSPLNMYLRDRARPKGAMRAMPNLMETELETFGASTVEDFTWKQLLDTDACTMCGRCTSVCPAHATGKPLDPREIVLKTGEVMARTGDPEVSPPIGVDKEITVPANWMFDRVTPEELWACTSCRACDEICPVNIEILDKILDMRRYLTLMESDFPSELGNAYRGMENQMNPWAMSQSERADWVGDEDIQVLAGGEPLEAEYLYWVGCAGSFDDKNKKVSQALAKLLTRADVSFAILGPAENCTGDSARRTGNEYIFQMLAMQNIETLNEMGAKKIITQCPHCFNTLANEYPQLGGHYEVIHHSQFLEDLIADGRLDMTDAALDERIVYHDACYLGRHNDVYMAPRNVVGSLGGVQVLEAERNGTKSMCCGAGGGRFWLEETVGKDVNVERSQELLATGASRIATACPFCYVMIDDGVKGQGVDEDEVKVADIAIHTLEALERGEEMARQKALAPTVGEKILPITTGAGERVYSSTGGGAIAIAAPTATSEGSDPNAQEGSAQEGSDPIADGSPEAPDTTRSAEISDTTAGSDEAEDDASEPGDKGPDTVAASDEAEDDPSEDEDELSDTTASEGSDPSGTEDEGSASSVLADGDDLTVLVGIGTSLQEILNDLGISTFDQLAAMDSDYRRRLDDHLDFGGRIERDDWVGQAADLATGKSSELPDLPG